MSRARVACGLIITVAAASSGCGSAEAMNGFRAADARARVTQDAIDACSVRSGHLVIEIERVLIREYPRSSADRFNTHKQPLLLLWVREREGGPGATVLTPLAAPEEYRAGDAVRFFEGRRLLDQPIRLLRGKYLDLRLAENNRTAEPSWVRYAGFVAQGAGGAASLAGYASPPSSVVTMALDQLKKIDRDDLILLWSVDIDEVVAGLGDAASAHRATRYRMSTTRVTPKNEPSAELSLVAFLEAEPGCL